MNLNRFFRSDISTIALILANIVTIVFAVVQKWNVADVLWLYLVQSLIIGCFVFLRILKLKQFYTKGLVIKDKPNQWSQVEPTLTTKRGTARGVLLFTIIWNAFYALFLYVMFGTPHLSGAPVTGFVICILIFLANHGFSYLYNRIKDRNRRPNIGTISRIVVARVIPMHLTIILGSWLVKENTQESMSGSVAILVLFLILKTIVDVMMHNAEHSAEQEEEDTGSI